MTEALACSKNDAMMGYDGKALQEGRKAQEVTEELSMGKKGIGIAAVCVFICVMYLVQPAYPARASGQSESVALLIQQYEAYQEAFEAIGTLGDVEAAGYEIIESQRFPVVLETFGEAEVEFVPILHGEYHRLAVLIADGRGNVLFKTNQLETNYKYPGQLKQPTKRLTSVSFQELNHDGLTDIVLITECENDAGDYAGRSYRVGDVLFQQDGDFYRDWRISDKINRFSMNKSANLIAAYVGEGHSTEILYTATTLEELLEHGFQVVQEHSYHIDFEKQGRLLVVPGFVSIADYDVFMIYLVNGEGDIVWSFQPMEDYDNLYALKGMVCRDMDGDGMKDVVVLARYSYAGADGELLIDTKCDIYYQRTDGFEAEKNFSEICQCTEEDTMDGLVEIIREYWGWPKEE